MSLLCLFNLKSLNSFQQDAFNTECNTISSLDPFGMTGKICRKLCISNTALIINCTIISISVNIDPNDDCIDLAVFIGGRSDFSIIPNGDSRNGQWSIKISQFNCGFNNLPPQGCTQWYFGQLSGIVRYSHCLSRCFDGKKSRSF